jgi:hypothetical protein
MKQEGIAEKWSSEQMVSMSVPVIHYVPAISFPDINAVQTREISPMNNLDHFQNRLSHSSPVNSIHSFSLLFLTQNTDWIKNYEIHRIIPYLR